jgi:DNA repair protein RadC
LQIKTPADAAQLLLAEMGVLEQEEVRTLLLDTRNRVIGAPMIYRGSLNTCSMRMGEVFKDAIRWNAAALILAHNHPSGDPAPSAEDVRVTKMLVQAGKLLDIDMLDHLVISQSRYVSLKERGLGFDD